MTKKRDTVRRQQWFSLDTPYADAIATVEAALREQYDVETIESVEATVMQSDEWRVTVEGALTPDGGTA